MNSIKVKRVYDQACEADGTRILVDRLWPQGITKQQLHHDQWLQEVAPSNGLNRWFAQRLERWPEFRQRYSAELDAQPEGVRALCSALESGPVTLLYSATDTKHNNAVALREYLLAHAAGTSCKLPAGGKTAEVTCS